MSKNNTITKSDKTFIRREKARIRAQFLDVKKQTELINALYAKILAKPHMAAGAKAEAPKEETKKMEVKKEAKKAAVKKEKKVTAKA